MNPEATAISSISKFNQFYVDLPGSLFNHAIQGGFPCCISLLKQVGQAQLHHSIQLSILMF